MIRVTHKENHKHLGFPDNEIILSGPPSSLRGSVTLQNSSDEHVYVREVPMKNANSADTAFPVRINLKPGEIKSKNVYYSIDPLTPPGTYEVSLQAGKTTKKAKLIVHEALNIQLSPQHIVLEGIEPGRKHTKEILFSNKGNIPVTIPNIKHNTLTDMDLICRNLSQAIRDKGDEGIEKTLDAFTKGLKNDITDWVNVVIKEAGQVVQPGNTILLHIDIALPKGVNKNFHYTGDIRMFDKLIRYTAIDKAAADVVS